MKNLFFAKSDNVLGRVLASGKKGLLAFLYSIGVLNCEAAKEPDKQLDSYQTMIVSKYFNDEKDFINLEKTSKKMFGNLEKLFYNPITLTDKNRKFFPNIETQHLYTRDDKIYPDPGVYAKDKIKKYVVWYPVSYEESIHNINNRETEYRNVIYTSQDRAKYGNRIPDGVVGIGDKCFFRCEDLNSVIIPPSVTHIGNSCFYECENLTSIVIPASVSFIGELYFYGCSKLKEIKVIKEPNEKNKDIIEKLIRDCGNNVTVLNTNGEAIEDEIWHPISYKEYLAAKDKDKYRNVVYTRKDRENYGYAIPAGVTALGGWCFSKSEVTSVVIPESVTSIGESCFFKCKKLTSVTVPASVRFLGNACFFKCGGQIKVVRDPNGKNQFIIEKLIRDYKDKVIVVDKNALEESVKKL